MECSATAICDETKRYVETLGFRCVFKHKYRHPLPLLDTTLPGPTGLGLQRLLSEI